MNTFAAASHADHPCLQVSSQSLQLQQVSSCQACSPGSMALSLDWQQLASHAASQSNESGGSSSSSSSSSAGHWEVAVSGSAGDLAIVRVREGVCRVGRAGTILNVLCPVELE
jgi:hypothetical protein